MAATLDAVQPGPFFKGRWRAFGAAIVSLAAAIAIVVGLRAATRALFSDDPPAHVREQLRIMAADARSWNGECPDRTVLAAFPFDPDTYFRDSDVVAAAAYFGDLDAIRCELSLIYKSELEPDQLELEIRYTWLTYAVMRGEDPARVEERLREIEAALPEDRREWALWYAEGQAELADWATSQGWLESSDPSSDGLH